MKLYYVKTDLYGVASGRVERFTDQAAGRHLAEGSIEPFDPKNSKHAAALKAQDKANEDRRLAEEQRLAEEFKARGLPRGAVA